jgi:hypothetical protein
MISFSLFSFSKRPGATIVGIFSMAFCSVVLLCGAGSVPIENLLPQGAMQGDLNAGGHNVTNAATINATNVVATGSIIGPLNGTNIVAGSVANAQLSTMTANTIKANATGSTAAPTDAAANTVLSIPRLGLDANGTTLHATTGAYNGQLAMSKDGFITRWTGSAWSDVFVFGDTVYFGGDGGTNPFISESVPRSDGNPCNFFQQGVFAPTGNVWYDNALNIGNASVNHATVTTTGTTAGTTTLTITGSTTGISNGMIVTSSSGDIPTSPPTTIANITGSTVTLSAAATGSHAGQTITVAGYHGYAALSFCDDVLNGGIGGHGGPALGIPGDQATFTGEYAHTFYMDTSSLDTAGDLTNVYDLGLGTFGNGHSHRQIMISNWDNSHDVLLYGFNSSGEFGTLSACVNGANGFFLIGTRTPVGTSPLQVAGSITQSSVTSSNVVADANGKFIKSAYANATAMNAASGSYTGQWAFNTDGSFGFWNGSNWTSNIPVRNNLSADTCARFQVSGSTSASAGIARLGVDGALSNLTAATGDFTGQLGISVDGHVAYWNGSSFGPGLNFGGPLNNNTSVWDTFFGNILCYGHLQGSYGGSGNSPTLAAGTGAGTSPTVHSLDGAATDIAGTISITTGSSPTGSNATVATITFFAPFRAAPHIILTPHNANAAALNGATQVFGGNETTTTFTVTSGSSALAASTAYQWNYHVIQ